MRRSPRVALLCLVALLPACSVFGDRGNAWIPLFDGESLENWEAIAYGIQGPCEVRDGALHVGMGELVSGVHFIGDLAEILPPDRENYELRLQAQRVSGYDFFCGLTFPVGPDDCVTLICGGWGGVVVGLSCLDGQDAANNETTQYRGFEKGRWYHIHVRVTPEAITCSIGNESVIEIERARYEEISVRAEMREYRPLGLTAYQTHAAFRGIEVRGLEAEQ